MSKSEHFDQLVLEHLSNHFNNLNDKDISIFSTFYKKHPFETVYFVCDLFEKDKIDSSFFELLIDNFSNKNYKKFLLNYLDLAFKPLNDYLILKIENSLFFKLKKSLMIKNSSFEKIKRSIFDSYYSKNKLEDCISFIHSYPLNLEDFLINTYENGISNFNDTKHYKLNQLTVCSAFVTNYKGLLKYFFSYIPYTFEAFKYQQIDHSSLQCRLKEIDKDTQFAAYMIYKNIFLTKLKKSIEKKDDYLSYTHKETFSLFILSHNLFSEDEIASFFSYVNQFCNIHEDLSNAYLHCFDTKNLNIISLLIYLSIKYNKKDIFTNLRNFFISENLNAHFILRSFLLFSKADYNTFNSFIDKKNILESINHFFWSFDYQNNSFNKKTKFDLRVFNSFNFFYREDLISTFLAHLQYLDNDIYSSVINSNKDNLFVLQCYLKNQIENF